MINIYSKKFGVVLVLLLFLFSNKVEAQIEYRWLSAGSFHNFYSSIGSEIEEGFINEQQGGWQWPAIYRGQDAQAMKALWLGAVNFTDDQQTWDFRVVHAGPRVTGLGEFYPVSMETINKFDPPEVTVDGLVSFSKDVANDAVDPSMKADRKIVAVTNTLLGITVQRTAMQFSQQYHDNYHIIEYIFTNTGNVDDDPEIEFPNRTVEGFVPYFLNRMAPVKASRHTIGNGTGWGLNTMNDRRGDGLRPEETEDFRAQFAWHGYFPPFAGQNYDNIGAPIYEPAAATISGGYLSESDTTGRLEAYHFVGTVTLHADASASDNTDDPNQPFTMSEEHNDDPLYANNSAFNANKMAAEYNMITKGRVSPRHAYIVEPSGYNGFIRPPASQDPSLGDGGGYAYNYGYGPYTLAPGESVRIVIAEASAGISRDIATGIGKQFKEIVLAGGDEYQDITYDVNGESLSMTKNEWVFTSRDSLFQTFERAIANFESDYSIPEAPLPPSFFSVTSAGDGINLEWQFDGNEGDIQGFRVYRAAGRVDSTYRLVAEVPTSERFFSDGEAGRIENPNLYQLDLPIRGRDYYYYIVSVGNQNSDGTGLTPTGSNLISNRYYSQSYDPARLLRAAGEAMEEIRVVPNPYNPNIDQNLLLDQEGRDRIAFYEIPGVCTIQIYTEIGELIKTIEHDNGSGDEFWDLRTDYRQRVVSGIYIARIINKDPNDDDFGRVAIRKIVIIL
ncbi:MAG: hypothetical protein RLN90_02915 [Balneolaceae bacterium]